MIITIFDYANNPTEIDIGNIEDIVVMMVDVVTGDEIVKICYTNSISPRVKTFDSSRSRELDFDDYEYFINPENISKWDEIGKNMKSGVDGTILYATISYARAEEFIDYVCDKTLDVVSYEED